MLTNLHKNISRNVGRKAPLRKEYIKRIRAYLANESLSKWLIYVMAKVAINHVTLTLMSVLTSGVMDWRQAGLRKGAKTKFKLMKITINPTFIAWTIFLTPLLACMAVSNWNWYVTGNWYACQTGVCGIGRVMTLIVFILSTFIGVALLYSAMTGEFESTTIEVGGKKLQKEKDSLLLQKLGEAEIKGEKREADKLFKELKDKGHFN